jgi:tRNA pseudouridine38-40 synthase
MTTKLTLEYVGTGFAGWARQPGQRTVQEEVERALATILREPISTTVAGRTDAGVHALGQVCSYEHEALDPRSINGLLPSDVAVLQSQPAPIGFDARRDAISRSYVYRVLARRARGAFEHDRAWWWPGRELDVGALEQCAAALPGTHDFTAFTPSETYHVRFERDVLGARWVTPNEGVLEFHISADTFMRAMNRILVGTMLEVAGGLRTVDQFTALLEGRPRSEAGATAPAHGLYLASVQYPAGRPQANTL